MNTITLSIDIRDHDLEGLANRTVYIELLWLPVLDDSVQNY